MIRIKKGWTPPGMGAWVPWPETIIVKNDDYGHSIGLIAHELEHVKQWRVHKWFFPVLYVLQWVFAGFNYASIPFEKAAHGKEGNAMQREWARKVIARNYGE